jgi:hypothetical protein
MSLILSSNFDVSVDIKILFFRVSFTIDELSVLLNYEAKNSSVNPCFLHDLMEILNKEVEQVNLTINSTKSKVIRLNPLKRDLDVPNSLFLLSISAKLLVKTS